MDDFPTVDALVAGMQNNTGTTDNWDVVSSYSVDKLNALLTKLWRGDGKESDNIILYIEDEDRFGVYYSNWNLQMAAPTLSFTFDGKAELSMGLTGTWQIEGLDRDGKPYPVKKIDENLYCLQAVLPLQLVSANRVTKVITSQTANIIHFDDHPEDDVHIVFDFANHTGNSIFSILTSPTSLKRDEPVPSIFTVALRDKLAAWMNDPTHVDSIKYALSCVTNNAKETPEYLVPEKVAFSIYSNSVDSQVRIGCLSVYIKTVNSGYGPGNTSRSFKLPATKGNNNAYPIPAGYTASLIIRHDLFATKFLADSLQAVQSNNKKAFRSITEAKSYNSGFKFDCRMETGAIADFSSKGWLGGLSVDPIQWDFGSNPLNLTVDSRGTVTWDYSFNESVSWSESAVFSTSSGPWGKVYYDLNLNESGNLLTTANDRDLTAKIDLQSSQFKHTLTASEASFLERLSHKSESIPYEISSGLNKFVLPSCSSSLDLGIFPSTNIFAPGQDVINVSGPGDIYMPYDVLILGHIVENISALAIANPSKSLRAVHRPTVLGDVCHKTTQDFVTDLVMGRPIVALALAALQTGDETIISSFAQKAGYGLDDAQVHAAVLASQSGPNFQISAVSGLYGFDQPKDLGSIRMVVDPSTSRMTFDDHYVGNNTDSRGHIVFTFDTWTYDLVFTVGYKEDGSILPHTFSGMRLSASPRATPETVSGKQKVPSDDEIFAETAKGVTSAWVIGIFGFSFSIVTFVYEKVKERNAKAAAAAKVVADVAAARAANAAAQAARPNQVAGDVPFQLADYKTDIENSIKASIQTELNAHPPPYDDPELMITIRTATAEAGIATVRGRAEALAAGNLSGRLGPYVNVLGANFVAGLVDTVVNTQVAAVSLRLAPDSAYIKAVVEAEIFRAEQNAARTAVDVALSNIRNLDAEIEVAKGAAEAKKSLEAQYLGTLKDAEKTGEALKDNDRYQKLYADVVAEELHQKTLDIERDNAKDRADKAIDKAKAAQDQLEKQEQEARNHTSDVYK